MDRLRAVYNAWLERTNPLAGLSVHRARSLYDAARAYGSPRLQYTYDEIELTDPVLLTCTERRAAAIAGMGWKFRARAAADATLAQEQRDALQTFANDIGNLTEALEHLDLAFFRGFAHVQPIWDGEKVQHITLLKSWNFLRDPDGTWYWNPECRETPRGLAAIGPDARLVTVTRRRAIDYPALSIHIRHALGERDWGRFVERYGIPPADITMAPNATEADRPKYENTADAAKDGRNIVLPNGASVTRAGDTRGVNPFLDFCEYQAKQILILATGGTLATLAEGDTGTLAGNAQENVWKQIVARDGGVISDALNRALFRPFLAMVFPNRPTCVDFELGADKTPSAEEVFDLAAKARSAGYLIAQDELEEASGYTLEKDAQQPQNAPMFGLARARDAAPPLQNAKSPLQNAPRKPDAQGEGQTDHALLGPFLAGFEDRLLDEMFKAAAAELDGGETVAAAAKTDANGMEHGDDDGKFEKKGEGASGSPSGTTEKTPSKANPQNDGKIDFKGNTRAKAKADTQATRLGYAGIDDLMQQSTSVTSERIAEITAGADSPCKAHEAIAALRSHATIRPNVSGEEPVQLTERPIRHYVCGERRHHGGEPSVARLTSLPLAIKAIRECDSYHHEIDGRRIVKMPGEQLPKGAQTIYERSSGPGRTKAFAYTDSGVLNGWQLN